MFDSEFTTAGRQTVARYDRYDDAQGAVDRLSDGGFPVQEVEIVGSDLHLVEHVTGRLAPYSVSSRTGRPTDNVASPRRAESSPSTTMSPSPTAKTSEPGR